MPTISTALQSRLLCLFYFELLKNRAPENRSEIVVLFLLLSFDIISLEEDLGVLVVVGE